MINVKKVYEDAMIAAGTGATPSGLTSPDSNVNLDADVVNKGIGTEDVIGKFDPNKGYMAKDNFFRPKNVLGKNKILKRHELPYGNKKKKKNLKNDYIRGMEVISEAAFKDISRETILAIHSVKDTDILKEVTKIDNRAQAVDSIAYWPVTGSFFIKYIALTAKYHTKTKNFIEAEFDGRRFNIAPNTKPYYRGELILSMYKRSIGGGSNVWVVWGNPEFAEPYEFD